MLINFISLHPSHYSIDWHFLSWILHQTSVNTSKKMDAQVLCNLCKSWSKCMRWDHLLKSHLSLWLAFLFIPLCMSPPGVSLFSPYHPPLALSVTLSSFLGNKRCLFLVKKVARYLYLALGSLSLCLNLLGSFHHYLDGVGLLISLELHSSFSHVAQIARPLCRDLSPNPTLLLAAAFVSSHPEETHTWYPVTKTLSQSPLL